MNKLLTYHHINVVLYLKKNVNNNIILNSIYIILNVNITKMHKIVVNMEILKIVYMNMKILSNVQLVMIINMKRK